MQTIIKFLLQVFVVSIFALIFLVLTSFVARAAVVDSFLVDTITEVASSTAPTQWVTVDTNYTITGVAVKVDRPTTTTAFGEQLRVYAGCTSNIGSVFGAGCTSYNSASTSVPFGTGVVYFDFASTPIPFNTGEYQAILFSQIDAAIETVFGGTASSSTRYCSRTLTGQDYCDSIGTTWYQLYTTDGVDANNTRIIRVNSPSNGELTASDIVSFDYDFFYNTVDTDYNAASIEVRNLTAPSSINTESNPILSSGEQTYLSTLQLSEGTLYLWRPILTGTSTLYGNWQTFQVLSDADPIITLASGTTTSLASIPTFMATRFPFSYIADFPSLIDDFSLSATSSTSTTLVLPFSSESGTFGTSTSVSIDLTQVAAFSWVSLVRTTLSYALIFGWVLSALGATLSIFGYNTNIGT